MVIATNHYFFHPFNFKLRPPSQPSQKGLPHRDTSHTPRWPLPRGVQTNSFCLAWITMLIPTLTKSNLARGALFLVLGALPTAVHSLTSYANDFVDPDYIVGKKFPNNTVIAQKIIVQWADQYAAMGPWSTCSALLG